MDMKLICLGTGSAFAKKNYHTNFILNHNDKNLLVDCGSDIRFSLDEAGLSYKDIDAVVVSHKHGDHCQGLEFIGFSSFFDPACVAPVLFGEQALLQSMWDTSLSGSMRSLEGIGAQLDTYFRVSPVLKTDFFIWQGIKFHLVQSVHIVSQYTIVDSFGLMFTSPGTGKRIYMSSDIQFSPQNALKAWYKEADTIIHDCETAPYKSGVHAHYSELATLPAEVKSKMLLSHYQDNVVDDWDGWKDKAIADGFSHSDGPFLKKGQEIIL